jgi:phosphoglycolate phosphatase
MSKKVVIFDLDGTLADSFDFVTSYLVQQAGRADMTSEQRKEQFAGLSIRTMAERLNFPWWHRLWLFFHGRRVMTKNINKIKPFPGIETVVKTLHGQGYELFAVSSNRNENIRLFLKQHGLMQYFSKTQGSASIVGKTMVLRKLLWQREVSAANCTYIGDEVGDMDAARRLSVRTVAVSWGYNDVSALAAKKPFAIAKTPTDILKILGNK